MQRFIVPLVFAMMSSAAMAIGLGGPMRDVNDDSHVFSYNQDTRTVERVGDVKPGWSYGDPERIGKVTSIRRELNGDVAVRRYGSGFVEEVWTETSPGHWEKKY